MATKAYLWHLANGQERWVQRGDRFSAVRLGPEDLKLDLRDHPVFDGLGCVAPTECDRSNCSRIFPSQFKYCPFCRRHLQRSAIYPDLKDDIHRWSSRGFPEVEFVLSRSSDPRESLNSTNLTLPEGSNFTFVVAGEPERLYALDRGHGVLWTRGLLNERWVKLDETGAGDLPSWSTSNANCKEGFVLITYSLRRWRVGWVAQPWRVKNPIVYADFVGPEDWCLGGAGVSDGLVAVPIVKGKRIAICWRNAAVEGWKISTVEGAPPARLAASGELSDDGIQLGAPVRDARENLYWAGADGYLFCDPDKGTLKEARWKTWPEGQRAVPQHRPMIAAGQQLIYQLCISERGNKTQYFATRMSSLDVPSGSTSFLSTHPIRSPFFSAGQSTFYENQRFRGSPWERQETDLIEAEGYSVIPLLVLGADDHERQGRQLIYARGALDQVPKGLRAVRNSEEFSVDIIWAGEGLGTTDGNQDMVELERNVSIRSKFDLSIFFFGGSLHLYLRSENRLHRWPLQGAKDK